LGDWFHLSLLPYFCCDIPLGNNKREKYRKARNLPTCLSSSIGWGIAAGCSIGFALAEDLVEEAILHGT